MKNKLFFQTPNLKINLLVLFMSFFTLGFSQTDSRFCGDIENFEFANEHETMMIEHNGLYAISELPDQFYVNAIVDGYSQSVK
jgi:hypothetical protein